jgi:hypothetical protein
MLSTALISIVTQPLLSQSGHMVNVSINNYYACNLDAINNDSVVCTATSGAGNDLKVQLRVDGTKVKISLLSLSINIIITSYKT